MASVTSRGPRERVRAAQPARRTIYVWEWPVRITHWGMVLCLIILTITGYYIHHPFISGTGGPGHLGFTMGYVRAIHEATGFVFIAVVLARIYWSFAGNQYASWRAILPVTKQQRSDLQATLRYYGFLRRHPPKLNGHNPLAALAYLALYTGFIVTILTGLGLFAWVSRIPFWVSLFGWTWSLMSVPALRLLHFLLMFWYIAFFVHHLYSAILIDMEERNGELSSMITGWKADVLDHKPLRDHTADSES
jgi:Ni/Fe-hydrogenase 1 B-type cytochrome subunit